MKRWIPALLVTAALVVLVSPGIVGRLAERQIEQQIELAGERNPLLEIATERFTRGWFTSEGQHRVPVTDDTLRQVVLAAAGESPSVDGELVLVVDTRIDHGLVPVTAVTREASAALPALASGLSTVLLELPSGRQVPLPGNVTSRIGLDGSAALRYRSTDGSARADTASLAWKSADVSVHSSADGRRIGGNADLVDWEMDVGGETARFARLQSQNELRAGPYGLMLGNLALTMTETSLGMPDGSTVGWSSLSAAVESGADGERVAGELRFSVSDFEGPRGASDVELVARIEGLDARTLAPVIRILQTGNPPAGAGQDELALAARTLLSAGATVTIEKLAAATPDGEALASLRLSVPPLDRLASWASIALAMQGEADVTLPAALLESRQEFGEQLRMLVGTGFLVREGDSYRLRASYEKGMATVNGAPLPVPIGGAATR